MKKRRILLTCVAIVAIAAYIQVSSDNHILTISDLESTEQTLVKIQDIAFLNSMEEMHALPKQLMML